MRVSWREFFVLFSFCRHTFAKWLSRPQWLHFFPEQVNLTMCWSPILATTPTLAIRSSVEWNSAWLIYTGIRAAKSIEWVYCIECVALCIVVIVERYPLLILMSHLHIDSYTEGSVRVYCITKQFSLNIVIQHIGDEIVSDYHFLTTFEITIFR